MQSTVHVHFWHCVPRAHHKSILPTPSLIRRLISNEDKEYFKHMLADLCSKHGLNATYEDLFINRWEWGCLVFEDPYDLDGLS